MPFIRSISGIRATLGDGLIPSNISNYTSAFGMLQGRGKIIVGRDGRPSGEWIEKIVVGALQSVGCEVEIIGVVPTPTVQLITEHSNASGGISITASHNPGQWNGLKFLNSSGVFLNADENSSLFDLVDNDKIEFSSEKIPSEISNNDKAHDIHISNILKIPAFNDRIYNQLKKRNLKVVVDAVNASGSKIVPKLLKKLGFEVVELFCDESGVFPHTPEPVPANLTRLSDAVEIHSADIGVAVDPDADRLVLIDENGKPIGEEKTIVLAAKAVFQNIDSFKGSKNIVINLSTSRMIEDLAKENGIEVHRSAVGEINVVNKMKEVDAIFGGEGSGGVILPESHFGRDSLVGIALLGLLMARSTKSLSELSNELPHYSICKTKMDFSGDFNNIEKVAKETFKGTTPNTEDGLRFDIDNKWVQIRKSNTEPIIRIISEAPTKKEAEELISLLENQSHIF